MTRGAAARQAGGGSAGSGRTEHGTLLFVMLLLAGVPAFGYGQSGPPDVSARDLLFEATLTAEGNVKPAAEWGSSPYRVAFSIRRDLVAQGVGTFTGPRIRGTMDFSYMARHLMETSTSNVLMVGWLFADDGAEIMYEGAGYAVPDGTRPDEWRVVAALRFEAPDAPHAWLAEAPGLLTGVFNARTGAARYRAFIPGLEALTAARAGGRSRP